jgi:starch synthase (maltosyl-transferring)
LILVVVNLDGFSARESTIYWDMWSLGLNSESFEVVDLLDNKPYSWSPHTYVKLDPARPSGKVAHIVRVKI